MEDDIKSLYIEIIETALGIPSPAPKRSRTKLHDPSDMRTITQKRHDTAIKANDQRIKDLELEILLLRERCSIHKSQDVRHNSLTYQNLKDEIRRKKVRLNEIKWRQKRYRKGLRKEDKIIYQDAVLWLEPKSREMEFLFHLIQWEIEHWQQFDTPNTGGFIMENKYGKQYPQSRKNFYRKMHRIDYAITKIKNDQEAKILARDGRWLIRKMGSFAKRLERERCMNEYLKPARSTTLISDERAKAWHGEKRYHYPPLDEIHTPRKISDLLMYLDCQLLEVERDMLIKVALDLKTLFQSVFIVPKSDTKL